MANTKEYASFEDTPQSWQAYCREFLVDRMKARAARRAGISLTVASNAHASKVCQAWIDERTLSAAERCDLSVDWVLTELVNLKDKSETAGDFGAAIRAVEHVGRHLKAFTDKVALDADVTINVSTGVPDRDSEANG